ncbi:PEP-CTERM sorting domain-containing protein [Massilia sp. DJPM01]|uniref:PEP-CTERM sorting domain-containing protein n=1 Tax=Massilia sp. DJPM01 TaxID=3024404 RepID=UPI00259FBCEE|nr:PEP-CTERM sorting domain-containing protein [Massilia sp. DJPM01]MDM5176919.1 PEP-CTERM sorting domain-containing protein [Massilia sp. DJPM01]
MTFFSRLIAGGVALTALLAPGAAFAIPIASPGTEGLAVLAANAGAIVATYQGSSANYANDLYLFTDDGIDNNDVFMFSNRSTPPGGIFNLGRFVAGSELMFRLHVNTTGRDFYSGSASRNPDRRPHARVQQDWMPGSALVSFEDLRGGPYQFNDLSFSLSNAATTVPTIPVPVPVPEPASLGLIGIGVAGLLIARRRHAG